MDKSYLDSKIKKVNLITTYIEGLTGVIIAEKGKKKISEWLYYYLYDDVIRAIDIAFDKYYYGDTDSWNYAFDKVGGICYNRQRRQNG